MQPWKIEPKQQILKGILNTQVEKDDGTVEDSIEYDETTLQTKTALFQPGRQANVEDENFVFRPMDPTVDIWSKFCNVIISSNFAIKRANVNFVAVTYGL